MDKKELQELKTMFEKGLTIINKALKEDDKKDKKTVGEMTVKTKKI